MGSWIAYLHKHPWQRWVATLLITITVCAVTILLAYPYVQDYMLLRRLSSTDPRTRFLAIQQATQQARELAHTQLFLDRSLDSADDATFQAITRALIGAKVFYRPNRNPQQLDRYRMLLMQESHWPDKPDAGAQSRLLLLKSLLLNARDNEPVRRAARLGVADEDPQVRRLGAILAGALRDQASLDRALADPDPQVSVQAILAAGLADQKGCERAIADLFTTQLAAAATRPAATVPASAPAPRRALAPPPTTSSRPTTTRAADSEPARAPFDADRETLSAAAYALARLAPEKHSAAICELTLKTRDPLLRERLLYVLGVLHDDNARQTVRQLLGAPGDYPSPATLLAGGKLHLPETAAPIRKVLQAVAQGPKGLPVPLVRAALQAGRDLQAPLARELYDYCAKLWGPAEEPSLVAAARLLGTQDWNAQPPGAPTQNACRTLLRELAQYATLAPGAGPDDAILLTTPVPSAAAALALWQMHDAQADDLVKETAGAPRARLAMEYIAWNLAAIDRARAAALALSMLPAPDAPPNQREDRDSVRACGALVLALTAQTDDQKARAIARIAPRAAGDLDFYVRGAYRNALLILGQRDQIAGVRDLLEAEGYPLRETVAALTAAGDRSALNVLLWEMDDYELAYTLGNLSVLDVLNAIEHLPRIDWAADADLLYWQFDILRCADGVQSRSPLRLQLGAPSRP